MTQPPSRVACDPSRLGACVFWAAFAVLLAGAAIPVLRADVPPLLDYPNHLARMHLLTDPALAQSLRRYYEIDWQPLPNLGMDLAVVALAKLMPVTWAMKTFIVASFALLVAGASFVHRAYYRQWSIWPLFAFLFLYNRIFLLGFLTYLFGLGLAIAGLGLWIALERRPAGLRLAIATLVALALFFVHLLACAAYGLMLAGYELGRALELEPRTLGPWCRRLAQVAMPFLPPLLILLLTQPVAVMQPMRFEDLGTKLYFALFAVFDDYDLAFDLACIGFLGLLTAASFATRRLAISLTLAMPLVVLGLTSIAAPSAAMSGWGAAERLPVALFVLFPAAVAPGSRLRAPATRWLAAAGLVLFATRMAVLTADWARADASYAPYIDALDHVPFGGRLALVHPADPTAVPGVFFPLTHLPLLVVPRRDAFVPSLFALPGQHIVSLTPEAITLRDAAEPRRLWAALSESERSDPSLLEGLRRFDAVLVLDRQHLRPDRLPSFLLPLVVAPSFALYQVMP